MAPGCRHLSDVALAAVNNANRIQLGSWYRTARWRRYAPRSVMSPTTASVDAFVI
jgi:hypothetical protein